MRLWNWRSKVAAPASSLGHFRIVYPAGPIFGVTAESARAAEEIVCEEIFHNQTIPGFPEVVPLDIDQALKEFPGIARGKITARGIWFPAT
jgi:hypothetical protein